MFYVKKVKVRSKYYEYLDENIFFYWENICCFNWLHTYLQENHLYVRQLAVNSRGAGCDPGKWEATTLRSL